MTNQAVAQTSVPASGFFKLPRQFSRSRSHSRPGPIVVSSCPSPSDGERSAFCSTPSANKSHDNSSPPPPPFESIISPAFIKGDLNFTTFRERAARAIAEWGPSPTRSHFPPSNVHNLSPRLNLANHGASSSPPSQGLQVPNVAHLSAAPFTSPPLTPLTPAPYSRPKHREKSSTIRRSSLKMSKRPRPSPLQLKEPNLNDGSKHDHQHEIEYMRSVRFADGSPLRGSTWHITQYPARLASPPISAAHLSLADLIELQAIKQSLGTWCGEMIGSPMRGSFSQCSMSSTSDFEALKSCTHTYRSFLSLESYTSSPVSCSQEDEENPWGESKWPEYPSYDSDCDSEIFEGMH